MADTAHHQILKDSGLSVTAQRLALMDAVAANPHATTDELTEVVRGKMGTSSRTKRCTTRSESSPRRG